MFDLFTALLAGIAPATMAGVGGLAMGCLWPLLNSRRQILAIQVVSSVLFGLHYALLGAHTAAAMCVAGALQGVAASTLNRRWATGVIGATVAVSIGVTALSWTGITSLLAQCGQIASALGRLRRTPQAIRYTFLGSEAFWTTHNFLVGSRWALISDAMSITTLLIGIGRGWMTGARPWDRRPKVAHKVAPKGVMGAARA